MQSFTKIFVLKDFSYGVFQIDELHRHNQSLVGTLHATFLLWSADMKTAVSDRPTQVIPSHLEEDFCCEPRILFMEGNTVRYI